MSETPICTMLSLESRPEESYLGSLRPLVVVPTYDEAQHVLPLTRGVLEALPHGRILFVDDGSPDGTGERIREISESECRVSLYSRPQKLGLGSAYREGFREAMAHDHDVVITMDADLSHDPSHLPSLLAAAGRHDLVIGSRYVPGGGIRNWPAHRRLLSRVANRVARELLCHSISDWTSGFRAYRTAMLRELPLDRIRSSGYSFLEEISYYAVSGGFRIEEVPIVFVDRRGGRSKISSREILFAVYHLFRLRLLGASHSRRVRPSEPETSSVFAGEL